MRKVKGEYSTYEAEGQKVGWVTHAFDLGYFHGWGSQSTEYEMGGVSDTVAIIELMGGKVITTAPNRITFIDKIIEEEQK